jgi:rubredoxin
VLKEGTVDKYKCTVCGYVYDPAIGDSTQGIAAGTSFEKLPDSWVCPECGVGKDMFEKI